MKVTKEDQYGIISQPSRSNEIPSSEGFILITLASMPIYIVEERSSRHGPGGLPPERGGGFSPVCLRPLYYQLLMSIKSVTWCPRSGLI